MIARDRLADGLCWKCGDFDIEIGRSEWMCWVCLGVMAYNDRKRRLYARMEADYARARR